MTTRSSVERFLALRHLALAGASRRGKGFGNSVLATLQGQGYEVSLVHPEVTEIGGVPCVASVQDLPDGECILMFARPTGIHRFHRWLRGLLGKLPRDE